jgi:hypothetical protein
MTTKQIVALLGENVSKRKGQFRYWMSYYWGITASADKLVAKVKEKIPSAVITDSGNHFHGFVGSAKSGTAKDSYLWVTFTVPETTATKQKDEISRGIGFNEETPFDTPVPSYLVR